MKRGRNPALDLTFAEFLEVLKKRGHGERAEAIEDKIIDRLKPLMPPLTKEQIYGVTVEALGMIVDISSDYLKIQAKRKTKDPISARIQQLEKQGFTMVRGAKYG